jgi:enamine deaminase RidA (YjgF/YER057c/UK114 family)
MGIAQRLESLGIVLPSPASPAGNYVPTLVVGDMVYVAGQLPRRDGMLAYAGKVGAELDVEQGQLAARLCALNVLAQLKVACGGDLDRVVQCVRLTGFVNCVPGFTEQPKVLNGASDLMVEVFGDAGRHVRTAVGCHALPSGATCEVESLFRIRADAATAGNPRR